MGFSLSLKGQKMAKEIERRFFIKPEKWTAPAEKDEIIQAYLPKHSFSLSKSVPTELHLDGGSAFSLTITLTMQDTVQFLKEQDLSKLVSRIRLKNNNEATLTIKGPKVDGEGSEYEYEIPVPTAKALIAACGDAVLEKTRYTLPAGPHKWEVDFFHGPLEGLVIAEIELPTKETAFEKPAFLGQEITDDHRYANAAMVVTVPPIPLMKGRGFKPTYPLYRP